MNRRSTEEILKEEEEKLALHEERVKVARQRIKELKKRNSEEEKKKRTKRLIETGAVIESALGMEFDTEEKRKALLSILTEERLSNNNTSYTYGSNFKATIEKKIIQNNQYGK